MLKTLEYPNIFSYSAPFLNTVGVIDIFTSSVIDAMEQGKEISLVGFGHFSIGKIAARTGRNPRTGAALNIPAYNQPKFKVGQKLKDAVNPSR